MGIKKSVFPAEVPAGVTLYSRLAATFRSLILQGVWAKGQKVPTIPQLAQEYGVGTITVRQAFNVLSDEGLIQSFRGRGTFVKETDGHSFSDDGLRSVISDPNARHPDFAIRVLSQQLVEELPSELQHRHIEDGPYMRVRKVHSYSGTPFALMDMFICKAVFDRFPAGSEEHMKTAQLVNRFGDRRIHLNDQRISICYCDQEKAQLLDYSITGALAKMLRWRVDDQGRIVWAGINFFRGDLFSLDFLESDGPFAINSIKPQQQ